MKLSRAAALDIVAKKSRGAENSTLEIDQFIQAYNADELDEALVVDWLRAIMRAGMSLEETAALTKAMADTGETIDWSGIPAVVDKHSTGGVGDDVSLIAVPLAAACGARVAKLSGGALGHTGGTLDKLACIPGFRSDLSLGRFKDQVASEVRCAIAAATEQLAPADKKLYQLRHRTDTIASVPLITASVLSKKIAGGAPNLVIDVKAGRCAFMRSLSEADALATSLFAVGTKLGRRMEVFLSDMDAPLADAVGDGLELAGAIAVLRGEVRNRLHDVAVAIGAALVRIATGSDEDGARAQAESALKDGHAFRIFEAMVRAQDGELKDFDSRFVFDGEVSASGDGFVESIDGRALGLAVAHHKGHAGLRAGLQLLKRRGDAVSRGELLMRTTGLRLDDRQRSELQRAVVVGPKREVEGDPILQVRSSIHPTV